MRREAPVLSGASARAFGVAPIRVVLGAAGIGGAIARDARPLSAVLAAVAGAAVLVILGVGKSSRAGLRAESPTVPAPPGARYDPAWIAALLACIPSTVGVAAMTAAALFFSPVLASILAGVLVGLGVLALQVGMQIVERERRDGVRLYFDRGPRPTLYAKTA
jgi:hypothetical protein